MEDKLSLFLNFATLSSVTSFSFPLTVPVNFTFLRSFLVNVFFALFPTLTLYSFSLIGKDIAKIAEDTKGTQNVSNGSEETTPDIHVVVDKKKAVKNGLTVATILAISFPIDLNLFKSLPLICMEIPLPPSALISILDS